jgi:hypothetical protein
MTIALTLRIALVAVVGSASAAAQAGSAQVGAVKNIVLVHGVATDGSGWRGVHDILTKDGYRVSLLPASPMMSPRQNASSTGKMAR